MKWEGNRQSDNVEDRRGSGGGGGFGFGGKSIGIGTIVLALIGSAVFGVNPLTMLDMLSGGSGQVAPVQQGPAPAPPASDRKAAMVSTVLADTEDTWSEIFRAQGASYVKPKLILFSGATPTACGTGQSASGPFYCPADQQVYIDLSFYELMQQRFQVSSEFAQAYVIAHEVGHHVQTLTGTSEKVRAAQQRMSQTQANQLSVRMELQADCYAGLWAHHANRSRGILEQGDVEAALHAASAIGDDAMQRRSQGQVVPDSFTHGSSEQRARWFKKGIETGQVEACDTFSARQL
ncbi:neutral zinc metallopeptidase [Massilia sp. GCM10020059]|uniref:Zinc metallopeptidase n=1 Tax=Massilia agrisoli TaxID=2892444 RepID=A0ABS8IVC5_9BURK|nr:neutral zinc metallopeptidase [Massilia agrisoli]MCC6071194.1 zinc metallopeptidase [Massilia agrisoli]